MTDPRPRPAVLEYGDVATALTAYDTRCGAGSPPVTSGCRGRARSSPVSRAPVTSDRGQRRGHPSGFYAVQMPDGGQRLDRQGADPLSATASCSWRSARDRGTGIEEKALSIAAPA